MKAFANWVMKGRMQAVIAATVSAMLALIVTPVGVVSAAVIALTVLRQGWREGTYVIVSALLAIAGIGGLIFQTPIGAAMIGAAMWLPAGILGGVMGRFGSLRMAIEVAVIGALVVVVLQYVTMGDPVSEWREVLREHVQGTLNPGTLSSADVEAVFDQTALWMPGGIAATWLLGAVISLLLARYWAAVIDSPGAFGEEFRRLRFGRWLLIGVPLVFVGGVLMTDGTPNAIAQLFIVGMMVYLIQGISVVHGLLAMFGGSSAWLVGFYLLLLVVMPQGITTVAFLGYADGWLDIRARARRRSKTDDE
ncbi:DUF2232 domain-containing protein [Thiosocius teredinicola]|uniref:DUF2232 domain-containing protein n=1 Tax=Thiosocius teredinicola TaxID=1973002 RepID=UPI0009911C83